MEKQIDYAEQLLQAMKVVSQAEVQGVQFDSTIQCTITEIKDADNGIYTVNNGSASFIAYSKDTNYKINDNVLVTIPQSDYNQQKIIIGKYITKNAKPFVYKNPFDYFVDITGNLVSNSHGEFSILANDVENDLVCPEGPVGYWSCFGSQNEVPLTGYDTIGLKAEFMSLLKGFRASSGNYGLYVIVTYLNTQYDVAKQQDLLEIYEQHINSTDDQLIHKINSIYGNETPNGTPIEVDTQELQLLKDLYSQKVFYFDIDDMYGDPYDFDTYYEQQILFDISSIDNIVAIQIDFFQGWDEADGGTIIGSFRDVAGGLISYYDEVFSDERYMDNLYVKDIYLSLGYDESQFDKDKLILSTRNSLTYSPTETNETNTKTVTASWIHKDDTGEVLIINDLSQIPDTQLNWYRYKLSAAAADVYSGVQWIKLSRSDDQTFYARITEDNLSCELVPNLDLGQDQIKAILIYGGNSIVRSNILTFVNEAEVSSGATIKVLDDFYLEPDDGLNGVYNFYGNDHKILTRTTNDDGTKLDEPILPQDKIRALTTKLKGSELTDIEYIRWSIPWQYTMFTPVNSDGNPLYVTQYNSELEKYEVIFNTVNIPHWNTDYDDNYIYLIYPGNDIDPNSITDYTKIRDFDWYFYYKIKDTLVKVNTNNSISCTIIKDREIYSYTYNLRFGYNSTNGSDYTLMLSFGQRDNTKMPEIAMEVFDDNESTSSLKVHLDIMDQNGTILDWNNDTLFGDVTVAWSWETLIGRSSYEITYQPISHQNIPQYRKELENINENEDGSNAIPTYYLERMVNNIMVPSSNIGAYSDQKTNDGSSYINNYLIQTYHKVANTVSHINLYKPDISPYNGSAQAKLNEIILQSTPALTMDELYVLKVVVNNFLPYDLISYLPIPLYRKYGGNKPNYVGPDMVRYDSFGEVDYYKDPCKVTWIGNNNNLVALPQNITTNFELFIPISELAGYRPGEDTLDYGTLNNYDILQPLNVYLSSNPPYGIQYFIGNEVYWTQPIFCYQNQWANGTINKWDGSGLLINEEAGYIIGHSITAGKKESDNTFTGVMLGDLGGSHTNLEPYLSKQTGIYGFNHGAISYAFTDDGKAVIGKAGHGRIEFDGNNGIIKSSSWDELVQHGMLIDLDDGLIKMVKPGYYEVVDQEDINDFEDEKADLYRYSAYQLYTNTNSAQMTQDKENLEFYLPRAFYDLDTNVTNNNYKRNKFYIETIQTLTSGLEGETNSSLELIYSNNDYLINSTTTSTSINRVDMSTGVPTITIIDYVWQYALSQDGTKLVPHAIKKTIYRYRLGTEQNMVSGANYVLPDINSFTVITEDELTAWNFTNYWFYTSIGDYVSCANDESVDVFETYYSLGSGDHYISIGVDRPVYPLSIGSSSSEGLRKFRVTWDGYVYAEHGRFTGTIQAKDGYLQNLEITGRLIAQPYTPRRNKPGIYGAYIEGSRIEGAWIIAEEFRCDYGELGGWLVDEDGLYNSAWDRGGSAQGQVYLNSKNNGINLKNTTITVKSSANPNGQLIIGCLGTTGTFGLSYNVDGVDPYAVSSTRREIVLDENMSALYYYGGSSQWYSKVSVGRGANSTAESVVEIYANASIDLSTTTTNSWGGNTNISTGAFTIDIKSELGITGRDSLNASYAGNIVNLIRLLNLGNGKYSLSIDTNAIPASNQHGIYARFA